MRLRYWQKLALLIAGVGVGAVVLTVSYAQAVTQRQLRAIEREIAGALAAAVGRVVDASLPMSRPRLVMTGESTRGVTALVESSGPAKAAIDEVVIAEVAPNSNRVVPVWRLQVGSPAIDLSSAAATLTNGPAAASGPPAAQGETIAGPPRGTPAAPPPRTGQREAPPKFRLDRSVTAVLEKATAEARSRDDGMGDMTLAIPEGPIENADFFAYPIRNEGKRLIGWTVVALATPTGMLQTSERASFLSFAGALCGVVILAGGALGWLSTQRLRSAGAALARAAAGDADVQLEDQADDEVSAISDAANATARTLAATRALRLSMRLAEQVQRALLPGAPPTIPGLRIAHFCDYCDEVGGDYVDYLQIGPEGGPTEGWAVVVGDGTGHGVGAALLMATARAVLRTHTLRMDDLGSSAGLINRQLCDQVPDGKFLTLFLLAISDDARRLRWLSAGHDQAILFDPLAMDFAELRGSDIPLGVEREWTFTVLKRDTPLAPGTVVVIGTDGIWEMRNAAGAMFGKDHLKRLIRRHSGSEPSVIGSQILSALRQHRGEMPPQDDVTFVVIKVAERV
ncbi:hypothetical protein BH11PLA1_BH11PLA1_01850 [soil metagenome]